MKEINETLIKISGKCPIKPQEFELGDSVNVITIGGIVKQEIFDNNDGTCNVCYVIKPITSQIEHAKD